MSNLKFTATNIRSFLCTVLSKSMRIRFKCEFEYTCWQCGMFCPVCPCFCYICANGSRIEKFDPVLEYLCFDELLVIILFMWLDMLFFYAAQNPSL